MLQVLLLLGAQAQPVPTPEPKEIKTRIVHASVFKPGLVLTVREGTIPAGRGKYRLDAIPEALDGSFWFGSPDGAEIDDVTTKLRFGEGVEKVAAYSVAELLEANLGKTITFYVEYPTYFGQAKTPKENYTGRLVRIHKSGNVPNTCSVELTNGRMKEFSVGTITELELKGLTRTITRPRKTMTMRIDFVGRATKPSKVQFTSFEPGAAWNASYLLKLDTSMKATIQAKAQLGLAGLTFKNTEVFAMAGLPILPDNNRYDLAAGIGSLRAYVNGTQNQYNSAYKSQPSDPYTKIQAYLNSLRNLQNGNFYAYPMGGFGGGGLGGSGGGEVFNDSEQAQYEALSQEGKRVFEMSRTESLYKYDLGRVDMEPGDRLTRVLFSGDASYERTHTWFTGQSSDNVVQKTYRVKNESKFAWTGGHCLVMLENTPIAQITMPHTAVGQWASLDLGKVQDVRVNRDLSELSREPYERAGDTITSYLLTIKSDFSVVNTGPEQIILDVTFFFQGEVIEGASATIITDKPIPRNRNPQRRMTWRINLAPGETKTWSATYKYIE